METAPWCPRPLGPGSRRLRTDHGGVLLMAAPHPILAQAPRASSQGPHISNANKLRRGYASALLCITPLGTACSVTSGNLLMPNAVSPPPRRSKAWVLKICDPGFCLRKSQVGTYLIKQLLLSRQGLTSPSRPRHVGRLGVRGNPVLETFCTARVAGKGRVLHGKPRASCWIPGVSDHEFPSTPLCSP